MRFRPDDAKQMPHCSHLLPHTACRVRMTHPYVWNSSLSDYMLVFVFLSTGVVDVV